MLLKNKLLQLIVLSNKKFKILLVFKIIEISEIFDNFSFFDGKNGSNWQLKFRIVCCCSSSYNLYNNMLIARWINCHHFIF